MDVTRCLGWLRTDALAGAPSTELGGAGRGRAAPSTSAPSPTAPSCSASPQRVLDLTVEYAKDRVQFGRPIGSFQAVKHRCADMLVDVEGMRSAVYYAAWCVADDPEDAVGRRLDRQGAGAPTRARRVMASALQVHGGIGFTWEHDLHLYLKRAQLDAISFGTAADHRTRLARLLRAKVEAGESVI